MKINPDFIPLTSFAVSNVKHTLKVGKPIFITGNKDNCTIVFRIWGKKKNEEVGIWFDLPHDTAFEKDLLQAIAEFDSTDLFKLEIISNCKIDIDIEVV